MTMLNPTDTEAWPDRYNHPKVSLAFTDAIMNAKEGDLVGVLGNFLRGPKIRQRYKEALSTPVVVVNRPIQKGKKIDLPEFINFYGGTGTFRGKLTIFVSNLDENELVKTLLHEGAHVVFNLRGMPSLTSDLGSSTGRSEYFKSEKEKMVDSFADEAWHEPEDDATESNPLEITNDQIDEAIDVHAYSLVMVDPYKFLMLTTMSNSHLREIQKEAKTLDEYNRFNSNLMPFLWINRNTGRIEGHEGRHRAAAILANGEHEMPVAIRLLPREWNAETWDFVPPVWIGQFNPSLKMKVPSVVIKVLKTNLRDLSESVSLDHAQIEDWYAKKMSHQNVESNPPDIRTQYARFCAIDDAIGVSGGGTGVPAILFHRHLFSSDELNRLIPVIENLHPDRIGVSVASVAAAADIPYLVSRDKRSHGVQVKSNPPQGDWVFAKHYNIYDDADLMDEVEMAAHEAVLEGNEAIIIPAPVSTASWKNYPYEALDEATSRAIQYHGSRNLRHSGEGEELEDGSMRMDVRVVESNPPDDGWFIRYTRSDGTGLMHRSAFDMDLLDDDEDQELTELLNYGLRQPIEVPRNAIFAFTQEGVAKHQRLLELLTKAAENDVEEQRLDPNDYEVVWESDDGQVALLPLEEVE
ncbi:MAG: hypothetical protein HQM05_15390 [Magnetococcales bacterium]|nr:hypothetical protein [Magnetococcales bacterium]